MMDEFVALLKVCCLFLWSARMALRQHQHISSLRYNPDGEFLSLILALEKLGSDMNAALGEGDARRQQQVKDAKSEVTRLEEQLEALQYASAGSVCCSHELTCRSTAPRA